MASYPTAVKTYTSKNDGVDIFSAAHINDLQDEVVAVEQGLLDGFAHHLKPQANDTYDLGTSALKFRDLWLAGDLNVAGAGPHAIGGAVSSTRQLLLAGTLATGVHGLEVTSRLQPGAGVSAAVAHIAGTLDEAASGTHSIFSGLQVTKPTITAGAGSVTSAASLYVVNAPSEATNNYALWIDSGVSRLDGNLILFTNASLLFQDGAGADLGKLQIENAAMHLKLNEASSDPAAPSANEVKLYARDNGAGKTQIVARFNTGAVQVIATEP
ncbi:MAG: hypothetical protein WBC51_04980 [Vicinamibacterales bacterium]